MNKINKRQMNMGSTCSTIHHMTEMADPWKIRIVWFSSVLSLSHVCLFATPWTAAHQASLSITNSWSLLKLMSIESVMPSNHLILCRPLLLPSIFPSFRVFSKESVLHIRWPKHWRAVRGPWAWAASGSGTGGPPGLPEPELAVNRGRDQQ